MLQWTNTFNGALFFWMPDSCSPPCLTMHQVIWYCAKQLKKSTYDKHLLIGGLMRTNCRQLFALLSHGSTDYISDALAMFQPCKRCCDGPHYKDHSSGNDHCHLGVWPVPTWQLHAQWLAQCSCSCLNACNQGPRIALVIFFSHLTCYYRSSLWVSTLKHSKHFNSNLESSMPSVSPFIAM